ncbi:MAG TPA: hypothetical protein VM434_05070 [Beijerinckiaceae bacterium]|nr:hypothetical protein [Beijerinckiaceae bacterium]
MNPRYFAPVVCWIEYRDDGFITANQIGGIGYAEDLLDKGKRVLILDREAPVDFASRHYVDLSGDEPRVVPRPLLPALPKTDAAVDEPIRVPGLPAGTKVEVFGAFAVTAIHAGGDLDLVFPLPGTYHVNLSGFPWQRASYTIEVA